MSVRRCIFCGRLIDLDKQALFRLPPDRTRRPDAVYRRYLAIRGITGEDHNLPDICGIGSPEVSMMIIENGKPVLVTKTGRNTDTLICPTCHNEVLRDTYDTTVNSTVIFGGKDSGKTSLVLELANECITRQFSPDDRYRYFFSDKTYDPELITDAAQKVRNDEKPDDLRRPTAIYRVTGASKGSTTICDVMHDVSDDDLKDTDSINFTLPFAAFSKHFVYCIPADRLAAAITERPESSDMEMRMDMYRMIEACRYAEIPPILDLTVTKLDLAEKAGGAGADIMRCHADERTLKNYIYTAYPCLSEFESFFPTVHAYAVSAVSPDIGGADALLPGKLYMSIFE